MTFSSLTPGTSWHPGLCSLSCLVCSLWCRAAFLFPLGAQASVLGPLLLLLDGSCNHKMARTSLFLQSCWAISTLQLLHLNAKFTSECWLTTWPGPCNHLPLSTWGWLLAFWCLNSASSELTSAPCSFSRGQFIQGAFPPPFFPPHLLLPSFPCYIKQIFIKWLASAALPCVMTEPVIYIYANIWELKFHMQEKWSKISQT